MFLQVCVCPRGGVHGCRGACMVAGGHVWLPGVCAWLCGGVHGERGGMHGEGGCVVKVGHLWQRGACLAKGGVHGI